MGNNASANEFPPHHWVFKQRCDNYDLYMNNFGLFAEKHFVPNNTKISSEEEMQIYHYRNKVNKPIVKVF